MSWIHWGKWSQLKNIRLREEKEETKALVTDISHQLKTPLSALKMCASILSVETLEAVEKKNFLNRMEDQIDRLEGLVSAFSQYFQAGNRYDILKTGTV